MVALPIVIQIYLSSMDQLTMIFFRRLPGENIDTLEKVFQEAVTFTKKGNPNREGNIIILLPLISTSVLSP